ncbi:hypothetical protein AK830_g6117 [Neonectria ditissima]|uniref:Calcineurin-like phosphoesterase domain-containing protein n=1 Tax=Neonectria ditissima TaxID=78410 RepID=A0A0P7BD34_9HYPO|nr:hypothetical protein AK830_g6117 [Neonectria ditissima]
MTTPTPKIKTRILIISDTHGFTPKPKLVDDASTEDELSQEDVMWVRTGFREPLAQADVVLHCGDLTKRSRVSEFSDTFAMLRAVRAPLKLVIAGNHDSALDKGWYEREWGQSNEVIDQVQDIVQAARSDGVHYLTEGVYSFTLENGARLKVYASQYTPSYGGWAFQYDIRHDFNIPSDVDVAMTHGPPRGILDFAGMTGTHAGCPDLYDAVYRAKPKIHCFGHIHEAWGCQLVQWGSGNTQGMKVRDIMPNRVTQDAETMEARRHKLIEMSQKRGAYVDLSEGPGRAVAGEQTLFVNAAIMDMRYRATHLPWIVDVELERA